MNNGLVWPSDMLWKPSKQTQRAINRGNRLAKKYIERKQQEYSERLTRAAFGSASFPQGPSGE